MKPIFELYQDKIGLFRFRLKAGNGQTILASEGYKDRSGATNGIESVKKNAAVAARFEKKTLANGKPYFVLKAFNNQVIGNSDLYESDEGCRNGMLSVMKNAPIAEIEDRTR